MGVALQSARRLLVIQRVLPHYRTAVFRELADRFPGEFILGASRSLPTDLTPLGIETDLPIRDLEVAEFAFRRSPFLFRMSGLRSLLEDVRPSVVVVEGNPRIISTWAIPKLCARLGVGSIAWTKFSGDGSSRLVGRVWKRYLAKWDAIISYGEGGRLGLPQYGVPPERIFVAQNTVSLPESPDDLRRVQERADRLRQRLGFGGVRIVVALGRLVRQKRFDEVIRAFVEVRKSRPDSVLVVVGTGPEETSLRQLADRLIDEASLDSRVVRFTGVVPDGEDAVWLRLADVAVFAGAVGLGLNVSLSVGTATLIADEPGCDSELLVDGLNGVRFPPGDISALARALARLLDDHQTRQELRVAGRNTVLSKATISHMVAGMEAAIRYVEGLGTKPLTDPL